MNDRVLSNPGLGVTLLSAAFIIFFITGATFPEFDSRFLGTAAFHHDAFLNAGVLEWGYRSIWSPGRHLFEWTAGFPAQNTLAGTENLIGWQLLYSPLRAAGTGVVASYNVLLLTSLLVSAIGGAALAQELGANRWGASFAGLAFAFNPFHLNHAAHLQSMAICWVPFAILYFDRYLSSGRLKYSIATAAVTLLTFACGLYAGLMLVIVLSIWAVLSRWRPRALPLRRLLPGVAIASAIVVLVSLPVFSHYLKYGIANGFYRHDAETLSRFSLHLGGFFRAPMWQEVFRQTPLAAKGLDALSAAFPGILVLALSGYALVTLRADARVRVLALCAIALVALALGPFLELRTAEPLEMVRWFPMPGKAWLIVPGIRWPMRIYLFASLMLALIAALGLSHAVRNHSGFRGTMIGVAAIVLLVAELHPGRLFRAASAAAVEPLSMSDAYPFLALERDTGGVAEIPFADSTGYETPLNTRYVYGSAGHLRRVVAFHGNVIPAVTDTLRSAVRAVPSAAALQTLRDHGVSRVVVHRDLMDKRAAAGMTAALMSAGLRVVYDRGKSVVMDVGAVSPKR